MSLKIFFFSRICYFYYVFAGKFWKAASDASNLHEPGAKLSLSFIYPFTLVVLEIQTRWENLISISLQFQNEMTLPLVMGGVQEAQSVLWIPNNENRSLILPHEPNFLPHGWVTSSTKYPLVCHYRWWSALFHLDNPFLLDLYIYLNGYLLIVSLTFIKSQLFIKSRFWCCIFIPMCMNKLMV